MKAHVFARVAAMLLLAFAGFAGTAANAANPDLDFVIENETGFTISELYLSPTAKETWGKQVLQQGTLQNGKSRKIRFSPSASAKVWDMKAVYSDGKSVVWKDLDLTKFGRLTLKWNKGTGKTSIVKHKS